MKDGLLAIGCLCVLLIAAPFAFDLVQRLQGNHYPGTAQQAGRISLRVNAKQIWFALQAYADDHDGTWPDSLADLRTATGVNGNTWRYPNTEDLPDRRDILKMNKRDFLDWIYLKPDTSAPNRPVLIAPHTCRISMGHVLPRPIRIVVARDGTAEEMDETQAEPILRGLTLHQGRGAP